MMETWKKAVAARRNQQGLGDAYDAGRVEQTEVIAASWDNPEAALGGWVTS